MTKRTQDKAASGGKSGDAHVTVTPIPDCGDASHKKQERATESRREEADRQAIERGEDDGMIFHQSVTSSAHNRRDPNGIAKR
jgi:hypothetical protein